MVLEDFTTYTEVDTVNDRIQRVGDPSHHIDHLAFRNEDTYVYKDFGVDHFSDFTHKVDVKSDFAQASCYGWIWVLANALDDVYGLYVNNHASLAVGFIKSGADNRIYLFEFKAEQAGYSNDYAIGLSVDTWYYLLIKKVGTSLKVGIYSTSVLRDAGDATDGDIDNLAVTLSVDYQMRYIYACNTHNTGHAVICNDDIENLDLQEEAPPEEEFHFGRKQRIYEYLQRLEREDEEELLYSLLTVLEV